MRGFTLLEVVVVVAIMATLSATLLSLNSASRRQVALFRDRAVVIGALTRAKALAIEKFDEANVCAFGVHFSAYSRDIVIFKDYLAAGESVCQLNGVYNGTGEYFSGTELHDGVFSMSNGLRVFIANGDFSPSELCSTDIIFIPPDPETFSVNALPINLFIGKGEPPVSCVIRNFDIGNLPDENVVVEVSLAGQITAR